MNQYLMAFGTFNVTDANAPQQTIQTWKPLVWLLFISGSIFFNIVVAKMMIAVSLDTYDKVSSQNREILSLRLKVSFLADYVFDWVGGKIAGDRLKYRYMYLIEKLDEKQIEQRWEGKIKLFQKTMEKSIENQNEIREYNKSEAK